MIRLLIASLVGALMAAGASTAQPLIGEPVPEIGDGLEWHLGDPVVGFEKGSVYLLDFWATWCPPCYPMLDHLSELQSRYGANGLVVVGIAVGTDVGVPLSRFLEREGSRITYSIGEPKNELELKARIVHPSIMDPTDFHLPFVMLVDRQGRLAWTSDPRGTDDDLDAVLVSLLGGTFDVEAQAEAGRLARAAAYENTAALDRVRRLRAQGRLEEASRALLPLAERQPGRLAAESVDLFQEILCAAQDDLVTRYGRELLDRVLQDRVSALVEAERSILALRGDDEQSLAIAEAMARRALALKGGDHPDFLFELAKVLAAQGRLEEARPLQRQAAAAAQEQGWQESYVHYIGTVLLEQALATQASALGQPCREEQA